MIDKYFGVHQDVIRSGLWAKMRPGEHSLYVYLMEQSERCCTRQLARTDAEIRAAVGVAARTLCNARKKLSERGLIQCNRSEGNKFVYVICDPTTRAPYPGDPKQPTIYRKRSEDGVRANGEHQDARTPSSNAQPLEVRGLSANEVFK